MSESSSLVSSRRNFLGLIGSATLGALMVPGLSSDALAGVAGNARIERGVRRISFRNQHTGEIFSGVYRVGDKYLPDAFDKINVVLRDFRSDEIFPIDPRVIDIIYSVHQMTGRSDPYEVLSGYRCPKTNKQLRSNSEGVAKNSLHMTGQAIDLRMPGYSSYNIRSLAVSLKAGGVGYYPKSDFVHMDSGIVREW
ncbi:MAG: DUF882 domain-containing protein [Alphaproteobacteria bacterium]|nr:DUF882 domain-containing protein [Alphaproteobacteria bacterium]